MFTLYLSNHYEAPLILDDSYKSTVIKTQAHYRGIILHKIFSAEDRAGCIEAWEKLKQSIQKQISFYQLN